MIEHGIDPVSPVGFDFPMAAVDETILSHSPVEARYAFTDDDTLALTVDDDLSVIDVTRNLDVEAGR